MRKAGAVLVLGLCSFLVFLVIGYQHTVKTQEEQQAAAPRLYEPAERAHNHQCGHKNDIPVFLYQ